MQQFQRIEWTFFSVQRAAAWLWCRLRYCIKRGFTISIYQSQNSSQMKS